VQALRERIDTQRESQSPTEGDPPSALDSPVVNSLRDANSDAKFGEPEVFPPPPKLAIKVFFLFRSLRYKGAQQVLDAWDVLQTVESGEHAIYAPDNAPTSLRWHQLFG